MSVLYLDSQPLFYFPRYNCYVRQKKMYFLKHNNVEQKPIADNTNCSFLS